MFPSYLINKAYVQKSMKNTPAGFEFTLKNNIDSGTLGGVKAVFVDGVEAPLSSVSLKTQAGETAAEAITFQKPLSLRYGMEAVISVAGQTLSAGKHEVKLVLSVMEAGRMEFTITDEVG